MTSVLYDALADLADASQHRAAPSSDEAPAPGEYQITYEWMDLSHPVVCHLNYEPGYDGGRDEPSYSSSCTLLRAYLKGVDISELLSFGHENAIEALALAAHEKAVAEEAGERQIDDYQARRA